MAKILLIETATEVCSAAIAVEGTPVVLAEDLDQPNHAARLTLLIDECSRKSGIALSELDAVAVSSGPGSYTSLRVGASVAKGICYALDKPLIAVGTLQALAAASLGSSTIPRQQDIYLLPMIDARRKEVWLSLYDVQMQLVLPPQPFILEHNLFDFARQTALPGKSKVAFILSGNGAKKVTTDMIAENMVINSFQYSSARFLASLAEQFFQQSDFQDIAYFEPFYMKPPNITTPNKPLF